MRSLSDRLHEKVAPEPNTGCWLWTAATNPKGYGIICVVPRRTALAHRVSYEIANGPIPEGLHLDHLCRVRCCVNPAHLEAVEPKVNQQRGVWPNSAKTHCREGHPYSGPNLFLNSVGGRECRTCRRARVNAHKRAARAARGQSPIKGAEE